MKLDNLYRQYENTDRAYRLFEEIRWANGAVCPECSIKKYVKPHGMDTNRWQCTKCKISFAVTTNTFMHRSHSPLHIWFYLIGIMYKHPKMSSYKAGRAVGIKQRTAWVILTKLRSVKDGDQLKLIDDIYRRTFADLTPKEFLKVLPRSSEKVKVPKAPTFSIFKTNRVEQYAVL